MWCRTSSGPGTAPGPRTGVGVGTIYRHFPTSEALVLAVYQAEVQHLIEIVPTLVDSHPPQEAFRVWVTDHLVHYMATKRGLGDALRAAATGGEVYNRAYEEVTVALAALVRANVKAGTVRVPGPAHGHAGSGRAAPPRPGR